jgi:hypothetical protein
MSAKDLIKSFARDLTSLEINTIRRASITGESMPDPRHALYDVAAEYNDALNQLLAQERRRVVGPQCALSCHFEALDHQPGQEVAVTIELRDLKRQAPMAGEAVEACLCPAPVLTERRNEADKRRPFMQAQPSRPPVVVKTDAQGRAQVVLTLAQDDRPSTSVTVKALGTTVEMHVPFRKVRGDLHAFQYLNHRANEAGVTGRDWLKRRIELNAIRLGAVLERLDPLDGQVGCDNNDFSRRQLNGDPETDVGPQQEKPPALKLSPSDLVALRKIWELGCEEILMQTVVQLDGDVVTRLTEAAATEDASIIHRLHADGVRVATQSWQSLVDSLGSFARALFGKG